MDIEKLIEQLNGYFEGKDLKRFVALDAATALSTLQEENEKLRAELENYRKGPCPDQSLSNSDRIRAMDDEELAKWLMIAGICIRDFEDCQCDGVSCRQCRLNWLQQPAEEDT